MHLSAFAVKEVIVGARSISGLTRLLEPSHRRLRLAPFHLSQICVGNCAVIGEPAAAMS